MKKFIPNPPPFRNIIILFLLVLSGTGCAQVQRPNWKSPETTHKATDAKSFNLLWVRSNVFIEESMYQGLATLNGKVIFIGSLTIEKGSSLNALDIFTGEITWETETKPLYKLFIAGDGLYVEENGKGGNVTKYDPDTGVLLWARDFWDSGGVMHIISYKEKLHVYLSPDKHKILNPKDGKSVFFLFPDEPPFINSGICGIAYQTPVYVENTIYYRSNRSQLIGRVCAVDIITGNLIWSSGNDVISNVVIGDDVAFVLVENGELKALNLLSGEPKNNIGVFFDTSPFSLYDAHSGSGSFFLAYDNENSVLLIYLGDSRQLFAFQLDK